MLYYNNHTIRSVHIKIGYLYTAEYNFRIHSEVAPYVLRLVIAEQLRQAETKRRAQLISSSFSQLVGVARSNQA